MIGVLGGGLVGHRSAALLANDGYEVRLATRSGVSHLTDSNIEYCIGDEQRLRDCSVVVLGTESAYQVRAAKALLRRGITVISTADRPVDVDALVALDTEVRAVGASLIVGAAFSPGVSTLLVRHLASAFATVDVITTARFGTGGPACAREHHRSMSVGGPEVRAGRAELHRAGSGRRLVWFPEPASAQDCYRAGLSEPVLLQRSFPNARRIQALQAATRRDRLTARLPMLRPPHPEGLIGATWAEVRGVTTQGVVEHREMAATAPQATGAAAMAAAMARHAASTEVPSGVHTVDSASSESDFATKMLVEVARNVSMYTYDGSTIATQTGPEQLRAARKWQRPRNRFLTNDEIGPGIGHREDLPKVLGFAADYSL